MAGRGSEWVFGKYLLLQIPSAFAVGATLYAASRWWILPEALAIGLLVAWVLFELALFPVVRVAYESGPVNATDALVGRRGIATEDLDPEGYVRVGAELWRAVLAGGFASLRAGEGVRVQRVRDLTLVVEPHEAPRSYTPSR